MDAPINIFSASLGQLESLEEQKHLSFKQFDADVAWKLGTFARELTTSKYPSKGVIIDISLTTGHVLFRTASANGTNLDNDSWVERKKKLVNRTGKLSFYNGQKLRIKGVTLEESLNISQTEYAAHGGCVPIRLSGSHFHVATLTISGLSQDQDHLLAIEILKTFKEDQ